MSVFCSGANNERKSTPKDRQKGPEYAGILQKKGGLCWFFVAGRACMASPDTIAPEVPSVVRNMATCAGSSPMCMECTGVQFGIA